MTARQYDDLPSRLPMRPHGKPRRLRNPHRSLKG